MDLVDYNEEVYDKIVSEYQSILSKMTIKDIRFIPISALKGDNVVNASQNMKWYDSAPLLSTLEKIHIGSDTNKIDARFPVQTVIRPQSKEFSDYRGYAGRLESGILRKGDEITVLPSGFSSTIKSIDTFEGEIEEAFAPMSIAVQLEDDIDISRGDMIVRKKNQPEKVQEFDAMLCWLGNDAYQDRTKFIIRHTSNEQTAMIKEVTYKVDVNTLDRFKEDISMGMNDICRVKIKTAAPVMIDEYRDNRSTGSFVLIDTNTNETVAAGMII
jgi:sulfate adenylyltransferase subunit 1